MKKIRVIASLIFGAIIGASIACVQYLLGVYQVNGAKYLIEYGIANGIGVLILAFVIWLSGVCLFGGPIWVILHKKKRTHWIYASLAGAVIPFIVILAMQTSFFTGNSGYTSFYANGGDQVIDGQLTPFGWKMAFLMAIEYAAIGTIISLTIWFINYKNQKGI